jgi:hypothetical protein
MSWETRMVESMATLLSAISLKFQSNSAKDAALIPNLGCCAQTFLMPAPPYVKVNEQ